MDERQKRNLMADTIRGRIVALKLEELEQILNLINQMDLARQENKKLPEK